MRSRRAQSDMQHRAAFGDVDFFAVPHCADARGNAAFLGELQQQAQGFIGDAILRVIQIQAGRFGGQTFAAARIVCEQLAQMHVAHARMVSGKRLPGRGLGH